MRVYLTLSDDVTNGGHGLFAGKPLIEGIMGSVCAQEEDEPGHGMLGISSADLIEVVVQVTIID